MKKGLLITGGNKGLGKALIDIALKDPDIKIISISRSLHKDHLNLSEKKLILITKDLLTLKNVEKELSLEKHYKTITEELVFINNAATIFPIEKIGDFDEKEILKNIQVNTATSILLTNHLLRYKMKQKKLKILNISSGASQRPILGWSLYCSMKAANEMFFNTLKLQESTNKEIEIYPLKGNSLIPFVSGNNDSIHGKDYVFALEHYGNAMLRKGDWKITNYIRPFKVENFGLYDISKELSEQNDLKEKEPEKFEELMKEWEKFSTEIKIQTPPPKAD